MRNTRALGLTLIELLISLAIMATVLCFSLPLFHSMQTQHDRNRLIKDITNVLQFARIQAFLRGETLVLAPLDSVKDWSYGIHLFVREGNSWPPKNKEELHEWRWKPGGTHLSWHGFQSKDYLVIDSDLSRLALNGYFLMEEGGVLPEKHTVNRFGRVHGFVSLFNK